MERSIVQVGRGRGGGGVRKGEGVRFMDRGGIRPSGDWTPSPSVRPVYMVSIMSPLNERPRPEGELMDSRNHIKKSGTLCAMHYSKRAKLPQTLVLLI